LRVNRRPDVAGVRRAPKPRDGEEEKVDSDDGKGSSGDRWQDEDGSQILAFCAGGVARDPPAGVTVGDLISVSDGPTFCCSTHYVVSIVCK
jgi:hypothetical protein